MKLFDRILDRLADRICDRLEHFMSEAVAEVLKKPEQPPLPKLPPLIAKKPRAVWIGDNDVSVQWTGSKD